MPAARLHRTAVTSTAVLLLAALLVALVATRGSDGAISGGSTAAASAGQRLGAGVPASVRGQGYAFATVLDGRPVRWNPCEPVRWTANLVGAPQGGFQVLKEAVARVAAASGTRWQYVGPTTTPPTSKVLPKKAQASYPPVLLGWTDGRRSDLLRGEPRGTLAMTRTAWFGVKRPDGSKSAAMRAAVVALDRTDRLPLRGPVSWHAVTLHELSHAMGLAHVADARQLMAPVLPRTAADLQDGDRAGLLKVGRPAGCVSVPR